MWCIVWSMETTDITAKRAAVRTAVREGMRKWGNVQRGQAERRDPLVLTALELGISKEDIHGLTGLGRTTIDRIEKGAHDA